MFEISKQPKHFSFLSEGKISSWKFQGGYTIVRYFPGGIAMKYGKFQGIKMFGNSRGP
jgi:hypothetical protein